MYLLGNFTIHFIGIVPKNEGQVLKQHLIDEECDLSLLETPTRSEFQIQRKKLRWALAEMLIFYIKELLHIEHCLKNPKFKTIFSCTELQVKN